MEAGGPDPGHGTIVVHLVDVAGDADGADDLAVLVEDELRAALVEQRPIRELLEIGMKYGFSRYF